MSARRSPWAVQGLRRVSVIVGLVTALILVACAPAFGAVSESPLSGPRVFGAGFIPGLAVASDSAHVWVASGFGDSVAELSASTGALDDVISGSAYQFDDARAITSDGTHVWVANSESGTVTELSASTGALVKVISGSAYQLYSPDAISSDGTHVWVANGLDEHR